MGKAAIYARVSTKDQSLEHQIEACAKYCEANGLEYDIFQEKISGAKDTRPELDRLLQAIRRGEYERVVVWKLDRLGRSVPHLVQIVQEFRNKGVGLTVVTMGMDTTTPEGRFLFMILAAVGELEREFTRERTAKRLEYLKKKGVRLGRPPGSKDKKPRRKSGYFLRWGAHKKGFSHRLG